MGEQSTLFAVGHPASRLVSPGSEEARMMTATSGRKWAELLPKSDPVGLFLRILLESSTWHSTMCYLIWKVTATPRGRSIFQLAHKMADMQDIAYSLWRTPQAHNGAQGPKSKEFYEECLRTGKSSITLTDQVRHAPDIKMWATPRVGGSQGSSPAGILHGDLPAQVGGQLNADWEECLMNFPVGWTDVDVANDELFTLPQPAPYGMAQYDFEPPRVMKGQKNRAARVKAIGNAVSPTQIAPIFKTIADIENGLVPIEEATP